MAFNRKYHIALNFQRHYQTLEGSIRFQLMDYKSSTAGFFAVITLQILLVLLLLLLSCFSCVWLCATPWTAAHQAPPSLGFSRQEYWSGVPLPSLFFSPVIIWGILKTSDTQVHLQINWTIVYWEWGTMLSNFKSRPCHYNYGFWNKPNS